MVEFGLQHDPVKGFAGAKLDGETIRYESLDPPEWLMMLEVCRYLCGLWGRAQDDLTAGALRSHVSGQSGHLHAVESAARAALIDGALAPVRPTRPREAAAALPVDHVPPQSPGYRRPRV